MFRACFQHLYEVERTRIPPTPARHMRLHRLERPEPWQEELRRLMWTTTPPNLTNFYPDYAVFLERVSEFAHWPAEGIVLGQGIESLIRDLVMLSCDPGEVVAFTHPTCAMFDVYARVFGAIAHKIEMDPDALPSATDIAKGLPENTRLVILPNPGQPVDHYYAHDEIRIIADRCVELEAMLAIDEAYLGFGSTTALALAREFNNIVILRTFSKAFGGASLRVGYALGHPRAIRPLNACRQSGELAGPSMHVATVLMDNWRGYVEPGIREVVAGRDWLREQFIADGYGARGRFANHVLVDMRSAERAEEVAKRLLSIGVRVRTNAPPVDRHLMVTCGSRSLMEDFYDAFLEATFAAERAAA